MNAAVINALFTVGHSPEGLPAICDTLQWEEGRQAREDEDRRESVGMKGRLEMEGSLENGGGLGEK